MTDREKKIYIEKIRFTGGQDPLVMLGLMASATLLLYFLYDAVDNIALKRWYYFMMGILVMRFTVVDRIMRHALKIENITLLKWLYLGVMFVTGVAWGYLGWFLFPENSLAHQVIILSCYYALLGVVIGRYSVLIPVVIVYCVTMLLPITVRLFMVGEPMQYAFFLSNLILILMYMGIVRRINYAATQAITLNEDLKDEIMVRKKAEAELMAAKETAESATRMKDQFISLVSHDLRSPLSGIVGTLQAMTKSDIYEMDREFVKKGIRAACESGENLYGFVQKLLDISRLQTGDIQPLMRNIITKPFIDSHIIRINPLAAQKGVFLKNAIADSHKIFGDPELMGEVISNLLSNAVKFSSKGDTVTVLSPGNRNGYVAVEDKGTGIPNGFLPDLFRHEVKTSALGTEGEQGTGLGLPHSADIVKAHGGELTVESKKGKGAVFTVTLPHPDAYVLVVDDQPAHREMMKEHIRQVNGVGVTEAENGDEALTLLGSHRPDVIITDLNMPQMDGFELIKKIRRMNGLNDIPVIAASSLDWLDEDAHEETRKKVLKIGANDFVAKPINGDSFKKLIRSYLP